jgi:UDP-N-acetylglucosamine 2-epimerase (non-hydrolysing)
MVVVGTRPEAIKMAPVVLELRRRAAEGRLRSAVCVTAQHRQMLDPMLALFGIVPDHDLDVMGADQTPARVASVVLARLEPVLKDLQPDLVLVQGDTTTVAAAALAAYYARARIGHVEAGLRTHDKWQPFPEEMNRRVAGALADLHFAPTAGARENLLREDVPADRIAVTGNPVIDALREIAARPETEEVRALLRRIQLPDGAPDENAGPRPRLVLVTAHRRENFGRPIERIGHALRDLAARYGDRIRIVYPVHLNPNVQGPIHRILDGVPNVELLPPIEYLPLVHLMKRAWLLLTDSGGIQEEAPGLGAPVLVLRDVTERPEAVSAGTARLVGTDRERIVAEASRLLDDPAARDAMGRAVNPYGDGRAAPRIVAALLGDSFEPFSPAGPI